MKFAVILFLWFLFCHSVHFAETTPIKSIAILGNNKTKSSVIVSLSETHEGDNLTPEKLEEVKQRLLQSQLFSNVELLFRNQILQITVEEKWTTIPILKFSSGGGVTESTLGIYDPNVFGQYLETGFQFTRLEDINSWVAWIKKPQFFSNKFSFDFQYWDTNRLRIKYKPYVNDAIAFNGFLHHRKKIFTALGYSLSPTWKTKLFYEYNEDSFEDKFVPDIISNPILPQNSTYNFIGTGIEIDNRKYIDELLNGIKFQVQVKQALSQNRNQGHFYCAESSLLYYKVISPSINFAQRINLGITNTSTLQYWYYLGGLGDIRGFVDNRFPGRLYWLSNSEIRWSFLKNSSYIFQTVAFLDALSNNEKIEALKPLRAASTGLGLRLILPRVYRFVIRVDYSQPIIKTDSNHLNFGVQQFF